MTLSPQMARAHADLRYCSYCDDYRVWPRCEKCGHTSYSMKPIPQSELPSSWRAQKTAALATPKPTRG